MSFTQYFQWECLLPAIPTIVERLGALAPIHDVAARVAATIQDSVANIAEHREVPVRIPSAAKFFLKRGSEFFTNAFKSLEQTQKTIESQLERTEATQNELQNAMAQNLQVATENAKKLTERVEKLQ